MTGDPPPEPVAADPDGDATSEPEPAEPDDAAAEADLDQERARTSKGLRSGLISLGFLIVLVVGLVLAVPGLHRVGHELADMSGGLLALGVLSEALSCLGYVGAFLWVFDRAPVRFGARIALSELAFGAAVSFGVASSIAAGGLLLVERGASPARVAERSGVLFLLTAAVNVLTLGIAGIGVWLGITPGSGSVLLTLVPGLIGFGAFFLVLALPPIVDRFVPEPPDAPEGEDESRSRTWKRRLAIALRSSAGVIRTTARLMFHPNWRLIPTIGFLWFDIAVLGICFAAIGPVPPLGTLVLAYQIGYLSNLLPVPGGIGVLEGSFVGMFALYGVNATEATAATVAYHVISLWVPMMWGTIAFLLLQRSRGQPLTLRQPKAARRAS